MKASLLLAALIATALSGAAIGVPPEELRAGIEKLRQSAEKARDEGRGAEAEELIAQARKLEAEARQAGEREGDRREAAELNRMEKREEKQQLRKHLAEEKGRGDRTDGPHANSAERVRHVMEAVKHLRAAGLKEPAADLEKMADQMRAELDRGGSAGSGEQDDLRAATREMHASVQEMRARMEKMQHQLDELRAQTAKQQEEKR